LNDRENSRCAGIKKSTTYTDSPCPNNMASEGLRIIEYDRDIESIIETKGESRRKTNIIMYVHLKAK